MGDTLTVTLTNSKGETATFPLGMADLKIQYELIHRLAMQHRQRTIDAHSNDLMAIADMLSDLYAFGMGTAAYDQQSKCFWDRSQNT